MPSALIAQPGNGPAQHELDADVSGTKHTTRRL